MTNELLEGLCDPRIIPTKEMAMAGAHRLIENSLSWLDCRKLIKYTGWVSAVYGIVRAGDLFYVGKSKDLLVRLRTHDVIRFDTDKIGIMPLPPGVADLVEYRIIRFVCPTRNVNHNRGRRVDWGRIPIDEIADTLNVTPGEVRDACRAYSIPTTNGVNVDIKSLVGGFITRHGRQNFSPDYKQNREFLLDV